MHVSSIKDLQRGQQRMNKEDHQESKTHNHETCKICREKEEKTLSDFEHVMKGTGMFTDFDKIKKEKEIATNKS